MTNMLTVDELKKIERAGRASKVIQKLLQLHRKPIHTLGVKAPKDQYSTTIFYELEEWSEQIQEIVQKHLDNAIIEAVQYMEGQVKK